MSDAACFDEMIKERFRRTVKNAVYEFPDHSTDDVVLRLRRAANKRAAMKALFQIALGFQDFHRGHYGGEGDFAVLKKRFINIADSGGVALPHKLHDLQFVRGKRSGSRSHEYRSYSTIELVHLKKHSYISNVSPILLWQSGSRGRA
jgi:hypothetical protein